MGLHKIVFLNDRMMLEFDIDVLSHGLSIKIVMHKLFKVCFTLRAWFWMTEGWGIFICDGNLFGPWHSRNVISNNNEWCERHHDIVAILSQTTFGMKLTIYFRDEFTTFTNKWHDCHLRRAKFLESDRATIIYYHDGIPFWIGCKNCISRDRYHEWCLEIVLLSGASGLLFLSNMLALMGHCSLVWGSDAESHLQLLDRVVSVLHSCWECFSMWFDSSSWGLCLLYPE